MSYTLRDAQHLCWKTFKRINETQSRKWTPLVTATDLLEKAREVAAVVEESEGLKVSDNPKTKETLAKELSDLLYAIFVLAECYGINLEESFLERINNYILDFI